MPSSGLSSDYLLRLCEISLTNPPEILACDNFYDMPSLVMPENCIITFHLSCENSRLPVKVWFLISKCINKQFLIDEKHLKDDCGIIHES